MIFSYFTSKMLLEQIKHSGQFLVENLLLFKSGLVFSKWVLLRFRLLCLGGEVLKEMSKPRSNSIILQFVLKSLPLESCGGKIQTLVGDVP